MANTALLDAVDLARAAAVETAEDAAAVGEHLGAAEDDAQLATHLFACLLPGYRGWAWSVTVSRAPEAGETTVAEAALIPHDGALLAPAWVPWSDRVRPGDLEAQMVLPYIKDDERLVPGYEATDDEDSDELAIWELGLGRERVLGVTGRDLAAERWYRGKQGPSAPAAVAATATCSTCAFFLPLSGSMRTMFGACANEWSPADGSVVSADHGCGAHSETDADRQTSRWPDDSPVIDTERADVLDLQAADEPEAEAEPEQEPVAVDDEPEPEAAAEEPAAEEPGAE